MELRRGISILIRDAAPACQDAGDNSDNLSLRIAAIFVLLVGSSLGALLPIWLARSSKVHAPQAFFFVLKYFGSGVILATAWMHLLSPASDNLRDECLADILPDYDWAMLIALLTVMAMFLLEIVLAQVDFGGEHSSSKGDELSDHDPIKDVLKPFPSGRESKASNHKTSGVLEKTPGALESGKPGDVSLRELPGNEAHLEHRKDHVQNDSYFDFAAQMTALFILEFGVIFHSIFIGLTLAVTDNFVILFIVLVFHQTFEGLGLGARLATATWPSRRWWVPYLFGGLFGLTTPLALAVGLGVRQSLALDSATSKIVNGVFDAISGGILMFTGLVELLAHEFMFNPDMRKAGLRTQLYAYACVALGVTLMAVLAKWA